MNITLLIGGLGAGGAERVLCGLADDLVCENTVSLLTLSDKAAEYSLDKRVSHISLDNSFRNKILKNLGRIIALTQYVRTHSKADYIAFLPVPSYLLLALRPFIKGTLIFSVRNDPVKEYAGKTNKILCRLLFPLADGIVFQTEEAKKYFKDIKIKNARVIANPISTEFLACLQDSVKKEKRIISVGRLEPQKNFRMLIEAFAEISDKHKEYNLVIYGEGRERRNLEKIITEKGLVQRCLLPGKSNTIPVELQKSHLFVSSSDYEGISNALLEAMAVGLPVISTDWSGGGARVLIEHEVNGILIPAGNKQRLAREMDRLISDEKKCEKLSENAAAVKERFSPETIYRQWKIYLGDLRKRKI